MSSLTRAEARDRAALVEVADVIVDLDLDTGDREFGSRTTIRLRCRRPGASTFVDLRPVAVQRMMLNGSPLPQEALCDGRLLVTDLLEENLLEVEATMAYSHDGQGLHRATDPADGEDYVYGHLFLDAAPTVFACLDQPDLKAPYTLSVRAPEHWVVAANGAGDRGDDGVWRFARTQPLATYFVTVCAGPWAVQEAEHDGIPLRLLARASLGEQLAQQAPQMFDLTRACLDHYHRLFGIRYPFGTYDQVFVPEFNAGAMENPGCVTFRDTLIFRSTPTDAEQANRDNTIAHEMAHMWFGDLVTMRWWDDLWLNESFAEYMSHRALDTIDPGATPWVDFCVSRKLWGYVGERSPSTHPVAGSPAPDALSALTNFDGISYAKGASVLRQLIAFIGDDAFVDGVRDYLRRHSFGNGELADFLAAMGRSSGADLQDWAQGWLRTAGVDLLSVDRTQGTLRRTTPAAYPAARQHALDVAAFLDGASLWRERVLLDERPVLLDGLAVAIEGVGERVIVVPNAADLTWAEVDLDERTISAAPEQLPLLQDVQARAVVWVALLDSVARAVVDPRQVVEIFRRCWPIEDQQAILHRVGIGVLDDVIGRLLPDEEQPGARRTVAEVAAQGLHRAATHGARLIHARVLAASTDDVDLLHRWAAGQDLPAGLAQDQDLRWRVARSLAARGAIDADGIEQLRLADDTLAGRLGALTARAALPGTEDKAWAWAELTRSRSRSNYELNALADGFWAGAAPAQLQPYADGYAEALVAMAGWVGPDAVERLAARAFPATCVSRRTLQTCLAVLSRDDVPAGVRRALVDGTSALDEALTSRARFAR